MDIATKNVPLLLLIGTVCRIIAVGAQLSDSLIILGLCALVYLMNNLNYNKQSLAVQDELSKLRQDLENHKKEIADTKSYVSSVKMANSLAGKR